MLVTIYQTDRYQGTIYSNILETIHRYIYIHVVASMNIKLCRRKVVGIVRNRPQIFSKLRSFANFIRLKFLFFFFFWNSDLSVIEKAHIPRKLRQFDILVLYLNRV